MPTTMEEPPPITVLKMSENTVLGIFSTHSCRVFMRMKKAFTEFLCIWLEWPRSFCYVKLAKQRMLSKVRPSSGRLMRRVSTKELLFCQKNYRGDVFC